MSAVRPPPASAPPAGSAPSPDPLRGARIERAGLALALALAAAAMIPLRGYLTDDTFIHLQFARHLAAGAGPVFNLGERVYGCTSPLWIGLIGLGMAAGADGLAFARALGALATLASVVLFFVILRRTVTSPWLRALGTVSWAANAWMLRWSLSGMETPLAVALVLGGFAELVADREWGTRRARVGAWWAFAALARPEALLLLALWALALLDEVRRRSRPGALPRARGLNAGLAFPVLLVGAWLAFAHAYYGAWLPATLAAKAAGSGGLAGLIDGVRRAAPTVVATDGVAIALLALAWLVARRAPDRPPREPQAWLPLAWVLLMPAFELARGVPVLSRYLLLVLPVLEWLAWRAADRAWTPRGAAGARALPAPALPVAAAALALLANAATYRLLVLPQVVSFTRGMEQSLIPFGRWLGAHARADASVATPDIGAIGYFSGRRVVDLGGLVTPRMIPLLERAPFEEVLARLEFADFARPEFVLDRGARALDLLARSPHAAAFSAVDTASVPNLGIARPGRVVYTLYRVDWTRIPRGGGRP